MIKNKFSLKMHLKKKKKKKCRLNDSLLKFWCRLVINRERERGCSQNNPRDFFNQTTRFLCGGSFFDFFLCTHTKKKKK